MSKLTTGKNSRTHKRYPDAKAGYQLTPHGWFSILEPAEMTNLVGNPSFELGEVNPSTSFYAPTPGGGSAPTHTAVLGTSRRGAWSLRITPAAAASDVVGVVVQNIAYTLGENYALSVDILGNAGHIYEIYALRSTGAIANTSGEFVSNGKWQRKHVIYQQVSGATISGVYIVRRRPLLDVTPFYVDGFLVTLGSEVSTYFDGDTVGYGDEDSYIWIGEPHDSQSKRSSSELSTGIIRGLADYNFDLLSYVGLGYIPQDKLLIKNALTGGSTFKRGVDQTREYSLVGAIPARDHFAFMRNRKNILDLMGHSVALQQPLTVRCQMLDNCGDEITDPLLLPSLYDGGMEGNITNLYQERVSMQFVMPKSQLKVDGDEGADVDTFDDITVNYMAKRVVGSGWDDWDTGANQGIAVCRFDPTTGRVYVGGAFLQIGSAPLAAQYIAYWDIESQSWVNLNAQYPTDWVYDIRITPNKDVFIGGAFVNVGGLPVTSYLAQWDYDSAAWGGGFGLTYPCYGLALAPDGDTLYSVGYAAGGGEVRRFVLSTATYTTIGTVAAGSSILGVEVDRDGKVYVTGNFAAISAVNANGIAVYDPDAASWSALGDGLQNAAFAQAPGYGLRYGDDGMLYVIGAFVYADGVECNSIARYDGNSFFAMGRGLGLTAISSAPWHMAWKDGVLYVPHINTSAGFVAATGVGGNTTCKYLATWDGTNWSSLDILLNNTIDTIELDNDNTIYLGCRTAKVTTPTSKVSTLTNTGSAIAYPVFVVKGEVSIPPATWDDVLVWIKNETTDQTIYLNVNINEDEIITIDLRPGRKSITSNLRGNMNNLIWPSSDFANFHLAPGDNYVTVYVDSLDPTAYAYWQIEHDYIDGAIYD